MRASSALALGVVLCALLLAAPAAAKRANSPKPKPDPPIEVEDIGEDELPPARPKSEKFDEREYHQYEQHKHDFEAELAKKFPKQNEVPLTEDMKTRIMEGTPRVDVCVHIAPKYGREHGRQQTHTHLMIVAQGPTLYMRARC